MEAIENGKHVVTANKALIAQHGNEIFAAASARGVTVAFEAAVGGGIPVIKAIREGLAANRIEWLAGIINGTGNFILTEMREKGRTFADVLAGSAGARLRRSRSDLRRRRYRRGAQADHPGVDRVRHSAAVRQGLHRRHHPLARRGCRLRRGSSATASSSLGICPAYADKGIELRVHPTLIPDDRLIANVNGVMNAVLVKGDAVGPTLYYGPVPAWSRPHRR